MDQAEIDRQAFLKELGRYAVRDASRFQTARPEQKLNLIASYSLITQALVLAANTDTQAEARKLFATAKVIAR